MAARCAKIRGTARPFGQARNTPRAIPCAARSRCRRRARNRARLGLHLDVVALASYSAAPACDQAIDPCRYSPAVFLSAPPNSVLRPEARHQGRTLHGAVMPRCRIFTICNCSGEEGRQREVERKGALPKHFSEVATENPRSRGPHNGNLITNSITTLDVAWVPTEVTHSPRRCLSAPTAPSVPPQTPVLRLMCYA